MAQRRPLILGDDGNIAELSQSDVLAGGVSSQIGVGTASLSVDSAAGAFSSNADAAITHSFNAKTTTSAVRRLGYLAALWADNTDATRSGVLRFFVSGASAEAQFLQAQQSGASTLITMGGDWSITKSLIAANNKPFQFARTDATLINGLKLGTDNRLKIDASYGSTSVGGIDVTLGDPTTNDVRVLSGAGIQIAQLLGTGQLSIGPLSPRAWVDVQNKTAASPTAILARAASQTASDIQIRDSAGAVVGDLYDSSGVLTYKNSSGTVTPLQTYVGTSTTSNTIATVSLTFTTQANLAYTAGARVRASNTANTAQYVEGVVTSYNSATGALVLNVDTVGGSGTVASWNFNLAGQPGAAGATGAAGSGTGTFDYQSHWLY